MAMTLVIVTVLVVLAALASVVLLGVWVPEAVVNSRDSNVKQWLFRIGIVGGLLWFLFAVFGGWVP